MFFRMWTCKMVAMLMCATAISACSRPKAGGQCKGTAAVCLDSATLTN